MNDRDGGVFAINGRPLSFWAMAKNFGNQAEAEYETYFKVQRPNGSVFFPDSMWAPGVEAGPDVESLALADQWRPSTNGTYIIKATQNEPVTWCRERYRGS